MKGSGRPAWLSSTALIFYGLGLGVLCGYLFPAEQHVLALAPDDCIRKPFNIRILLEAIERRCGPPA